MTPVLYLSLFHHRVYDMVVAIAPPPLSILCRIELVPDEFFALPKPKQAE
eukprot:CAMPEP_0205945054 /NCGR_PEP_ID=MMETSP1325-20131115/64981_1 /ASSEMBLY_ACC=CAM_ASM_000708 /TAXON_ID=236786 /ORGANISM="Florenciella sp., Strain RCC1007" /LENGTH=49 /DNA_ID= /DNA_START= /DNA_END= /DNA_ORIENTATION=